MGLLSFGELDGWPDGDLASLTACYERTRPSGWPILPAGVGRACVETLFQPVDAGGDPALITGYFEPELAGSRVSSPRFRWPLHSTPPSLVPEMPWHSRAEIAQGNLLSGHEIAWLRDPLDAFLAQVQGSVRLRLAEDGTLLRLGFAGKNGHAYRSVGAELVRRGAVPADAISAQSIRRWCRQNRAEVAELLNHNPSYVFFRILDLAETSGPIGASGVPLTPLRSLAVDPDFILPGSLVWLQTDGPERLRQLMVAQDTGSAIRGPSRADVFFGWGAAAGERAGRMKEAGRIIPIVPRGRRWRPG